MVRAIGVVMSEGEKYGYKLKMDKGSYTLAKCGAEEAARRKGVLVGLGLAANIIIIHPDDIEPSDGESATESKAPDVSVADSRRAYGYTILGSYVGTDEYIGDRIREKLESLRNARDKLIAYPDLQIRYQLFKWCYRPRIHHWLRTRIVGWLTGALTCFGAGP
jgi:hypothetical protein